MRRKQIACVDVLEYIVQEVRKIRKDSNWVNHTRVKADLQVLEKMTKSIGDNWKVKNMWNYEMGRYGLAHKIKIY